MPETIATTTLNPDVKLAYETIIDKRALYTTLHNYYAGYHPLVYSTDKLKKIFKSINTYFAENWVGVIVDAVIDRLVLKGFDVSDNNEAKNILDTLWQDYNLSLLAEDVHESATIVSEGFVIAVRIENDEGEEELDIYYNDARLCHMFYSVDQPNKKRMAAKMWVSEDGYTRLILYYKDHFEYYRSRTASKSGGYVSGYKSFIPDPDGDWEENTFEKIPVFHWAASKTTRKRDLGPSEISMQDAINKLLADMMVSSDFNSFIQRVIISKADPGNLPNEPGINWWIPQGDTGSGTSVQELGGRPLTGYFEGIDKLATALAITSRTPKHYFFSQGGDPSGEALIAMEAPLNKKVKKRQNRLSVEWQAFAQFLLELEGIDIDRNQIISLWEPAETVQPKTSSEIVQTNVNSGMPLKTALRRQGWTDADMKQLEEDIKQVTGDKNSVTVLQLFWSAAQSAVNSGMPLETFLLNNGWSKKQIEDMGTQRLAKIKLQQEDVIPEGEQ